MPRKTMECPTCGASLPFLKGEVQSCPECGMPIDLDEMETPDSEEDEELAEETEDEEEWE